MKMGAIPIPCTTLLTPKDIQFRAGIAEVEQIIEGHGELEYMEESPELKFLNQWEKEVEESRPLSPREKLSVDLRTAVEQEKFELAASLRDRLRKMEE
ncbi:MAG: UvrB/UvrC motif-containing protein [Nitrospinae bacterium]|nr:UvrB/UvrC motif-containing protein [Nitrospinota bacterium]